MRYLYTLALCLAMPLLLARLGWRGLRNPGYWSRWAERFGMGAVVDAPGGSIWLHAVSVGEVQAASPLVRAIRARYPDLPLVLTTTTPTGSERVRALFGDAVDHRYFPFDLPGSLARFLGRVRPRVALVMETELWPNAFAACAARGVPVLVVNARLSARSASRYRAVAPLTRGLLAHVTAIAAQTEDDARRLVALGFDPARLSVTGSIKFDLRLPPSLREQSQVLRRCFGVDRGVWIAASTHEGEERLVLDAFAQVLRSVPDCLLVLVPRHPERFAAAAASCRRRGLSTVLRSEAPESCHGHDVYVGDTMGELPLFYGAADVAFVGGSLVPTGGHNMLEPAALGLPVVLGPHVFNFADIAARLTEAGAATHVADARELGEAVVRLLRDANLRHRLGERGRRFVEANRGALDRVMELVSRIAG